MPGMPCADLNMHKMTDLVNNSEYGFLFETLITYLQLSLGLRCIVQRSFQKSSLLVSTRLLKDSKEFPLFQIIMSAIQKISKVLSGNSSASDLRFIITNMKTRQ